MQLRKSFAIAGTLALLGCTSAAIAGVDDTPDGKSPKQLNDPLPPGASPDAPPGVVPTPRGTPEGMGNEKDFTKTPGDDDPSDGVDEPGRDPIPGMPRPAPGTEKP